MTFGSRHKEIYIHLVENEPMFVCTVRYGGFPWKSTEFPFKTRPEISPEPEEASSPISRTRNRFGASPQAGTREP
jgi:hypothetical protein